ncbi:MAG: hypothetical protein M3Y71_19930 [Actinomycetota bacterium]|nr:hypothetical protein [Actinomycetota bacterium]
MLRNGDLGLRRAAHWTRPAVTVAVVLVAHGPDDRWLLRYWMAVGQLSRSWSLASGC